jgi:hypothetical protein
MTCSGLSQLFQDNGFVVLRGLLSPGEVDRYVFWLKHYAGQSRKWTQPDGLNRNEAFWPIIFNVRLLDAVAYLLGSDFRYLPHNDLHVGFSSFGWHRDNVNRTAGIGSDWDEREEPYRLVRVGIYLHPRSESGFRLGLIRGTHRPDESSPGSHFPSIRRRTSATANILSWATGKDLLESEADWIATDSGDAILFDPRLLHTGSRFHGLKYSIFLAYGQQSRHFRNHWQYYSNLRKDLGYSPLPSGLAGRLADANLLPDPIDTTTVVNDAWIPSPAYAYVSRYFK